MIYLKSDGQRGMRVLLIKTSSLGDILHVLPALSDAAAAIPGIRFDWVVEEAFAEVPSWHPAVDRVIPVAIRRWRKNGLRALLSGEWGGFRKQLRMEEYDQVLDAQGLIKSALVSWMARGERVGLDADSAREPLASRFYDRSIAVAKGEHAVIRLRRLFAEALGYPMPKSPADSAIRSQKLVAPDHSPSILFVHGTTWVTKHWPDLYWIALAEIVNRAGYGVVLPWGSEEERDRAERIAAGHQATILPRCSLTELVGYFRQVDAMVCVDSGLAHLGAALDIPSITLYGATNPGLIGTLGAQQHHLSSDFACAPCLKRLCHYPEKGEVEPVCYQQLSPQVVWQRVTQLINISY